MQRHELGNACGSPSTLEGGDFALLRSLWGVPVDPEIIARVCHEAHRTLQLELGEQRIVPARDDAPEWLRVGTREGVRVFAARELLGH